MKTWVGTSWKMNKTRRDGLDFADAIERFVADGDPQIQLFVIPPFTLVRDVSGALDGSDVRVGAQNMHWADHGPWTGEISPVMLTDCGADMVELGHSERREHFGETDAAVGLKVGAALRHGLTPLICVGETLDDREAGRAEKVLQAQTKAALQAVESGGSAPTGAILFAYEPVWAIGEGGVPAASQYADRQQLLIKEAAAAVLGEAPAVLYGGSVNADNCAELVAMPNIDGLFIGRAAWAAEGYIEILQRVSNQLNTGKGHAL